MTEDEMVEWHHWFYGHELEQALGVGDGQGSLACCSPQGHKESDTTEQLNNNNMLSVRTENLNVYDSNHFCPRCIRVGVANTVS